MSLAVAKRYSLAAFEAASDVGETEQLLQDAQMLRLLFKGLPRLAKFLSDERFPFKKRAAAVMEISNFMKLSKSASGLLQVVVLKGRAKLLTIIVEDLIAKISAAMGMAKAVVTVADASLARESVVQIESALAKALGLKVTCEIKEDRSLIGGFFLECKDKTLDASVKGRLARMREELA